MTDLPTGTIAVMTGASSGIGAATADARADRGATIALPARRADLLADLAERLDARREGAAHAFELDVADHVAIETVIDRIAGELGAVDILVTCAGVGTRGPAIDADLGDWQAMVDVNPTGVMATIHAALPSLVQAARGVSDIVSVGSIAGREVPGAVGSVYAATKHGIGAFSEGLRQELARQHVRVGSVEPGIVGTEMTTSGAGYAPDARDPGGLGVLKPQDVADAIAYLVGRSARSAISELLIRPTRQVV